ncbi:hypothetical protein caldi_12040 [Caldinitratiruptor microaerophilus]|uniref:Uncharacterized protein n=1 Tax=Caldinitratiruptor microaerophilus TaxID=671077 RepID=A0AA35CKD0_9FIRM|nr:hypothetical protein caldi_12040 [Caldinitratiruptor microaerophilus]
MTDRENLTGVRVIIPEGGASAGIAALGDGPSSVETEGLAPENHGPLVHAVVLTGGSRFGLASTTGVRQYNTWRSRAAAPTTGLALCP